MTMEPGAKRPAIHAVREHPAGLVLDVLGFDGLPERASLDPESNPGADLERARRLEDLDLLPGRLQPLESIWTLVEAEDDLSRGGDHRFAFEVHVLELETVLSNPSVRSILDSVSRVEVSTLSLLPARPAGPVREARARA